MTEQSRITIAVRRGPKPKPTRRKVTIDVADDTDALIRAVSRAWGHSFGATVDAAIRHFVASGAAQLDEVCVDEVGARRIADGVAYWKATVDQPTLDPSIHAGGPAGGGAS